MSQTVSVSHQTLYLNGVAIGCCDLELPEPEPLPTIRQAWGQVQFSLRVLGGKKRRKLKRALDNLQLSKHSRLVLDHYRSVKHHQLRKRWLKSK